MVSSVDIFFEAMYFSRREFVQTFEDPHSCPDCPYTTDKLDNLVKHMALGHSKLDELLQNEELVKAKKALVLSRPKKLQIGPACPICDMQVMVNG